MIVWMRAPPLASWVPTVCRNRWAVTVGRPRLSTSPTWVQTVVRGSPNRNCLPSGRTQLHDRGGGAVLPRCGLGGLDAGDQSAQRVRGLRVERDAALGVGLADRNPQPRVAVGVGVEAVQGEPGDLAAPGAAPPQ